MSDVSSSSSAPSLTPAPDAPCPCGSGATYATCCGPLIAGTRSAADAARLMRSRYTAHATHAFAYLHQTYLPTRGTPFNASDYQSDIQWTKLEIHRHDPDVKPGVSHVDFTAHFTQNGHAGAHHEKSEFLQIDGAWLFNRPLREGPAPVVSATRVGRNDPCPCGSGKKYKKCCGAA